MTEQSDNETDWQAEVQAELDADMDTPAAACDSGEFEPPGWLTPDSRFFPSQPTLPTRMVGVELGGHEAAAIGWLPANRRDLFDQLEKELIQKGFQCYLDTDGADMIKTFMFRHGFVRLGQADGDMEVEGDPTVEQAKAITTLADRLGIPLRHI